MPQKDTFTQAPGEMLLGVLIGVERETAPECWEGTLLNFRRCRNVLDPK